MIFAATPPPPDKPLGPPFIATMITTRLPDGPYVFISEANLIDYTDMALESLDNGEFRAYFPYQKKGWDWTGEVVSPWRVAVMSDDLNGLVNTDMIQNLYPPPAPELASADWIKPGRSTWQWMVTQAPKFPDQHQWVDWTNKLGFEYYIIDDGWKRWTSADKSQDAWACLKSVVDYAKTKNVGVWAWVNSNELKDPRHAMPTCPECRTWASSG